MTLLRVFEWMLILYFGIASAYNFLFSVAGLFYRKKETLNAHALKKIAVLIPGYKEDEVILEVAQSALQQKYPLNLFEVVVIADSFLPETLRKLKSLPIKLIEVSFEKSTKSKALNAAMKSLGDDYDVALVLDADNIMEPDFLSKINAAFVRGNRVVQGHRKAKNLNTPFAILDAISEEVNNHIFRKGHRALGLSSGLIGSGMAFDYSYFKKTMSGIKAVGGFDKELEFEFLKSGTTIEYLNGAVLLDEKVQKPEDFKNQRKRWLSTQVIYLRKNALEGLKQLIFKGNLDYVDKLYQMVAPPRILLLGTVILLTLTYFLIHSVFPGTVTHVKPTYWYFTLVITFLTFAIAIPRRFYNRETIEAALSLPKAFIFMFLLLFQLKGANKHFIHTKHGVIKR